MSMDQVVLDAEAGNSVAVKAWLDGGNRVNSQANEQQRTLLMHVNGHVQLAAMLIARGADINLQDKRGDTALMLAATRGDTSMVAYLLENGARTDLQNSDGGTALEMAEWRAYKSRLLPAQNKKLCAEAARLIRQSTCTTAPAKPAPCTLVEKYVRLVKLVNRPELNGTVGFVKSYFEADERYAVALDGGAKVLKLKRENVEECISPRVPPNYIPMSSTLGSIMGAATRGDAAMIETWLNGGGQVNAPFGEHGITLLMRASMYGHQRLVDMLLQRRADVNLQDRTGAATALMHAATQGHESVVSKLLKAGARTDLRSVHGTVLDVANDRSAIRLLLMQHADKAAAETAAAEVAAADKAAAQRAAAEKAAAEKAAAEKAAAEKAAAEKAAAEKAAAELAAAERAASERATERAAKSSMAQSVTAYLGQPDINAFNIVLHTKTHVAYICVRTGRGLSPGNAQLIPMEALLAIAPAGSSVKDALEAMLPIQKSVRRDRHEGEARGRPIEQKIRPVFMRCPVPLAAGVIAAALSITAPAVANEPSMAEALAFFKLHVPASDPEALPKFVEGFARSNDGLLLARLVQDLNQMMAMYITLNSRGEYCDIWSFFEPMSKLWNNAYMPANSSQASDQERLETALAALCSDRRQLARDTVMKCELMCEHMAAWHLLAKDKALASFMLQSRNYIRSNGLKDSYFGRAMMIRSCAGISDNASRVSFDAIANDFHQREKGASVMIFTLLSNEEALQAARTMIDGGEISTPVYVPPMLREQEDVLEQNVGRCTIAEGSAWTKEEQRNMLKIAHESGLRNVTMSMRKFSDFADLDLEADSPNPNIGYWAIQMGQMLQNRQSLRREDDFCDQTRALVRKWLDSGPRTLDDLFDQAHDNDAAALKLADALMTGAYGEGDVHERRDPKLACDWYRQSAESGNLEAMVHVAFICDSRLRGLRHTGPQRAFRYEDVNDPVFQQMIHWLGFAAARGHIAPMTLQTGKQACGPCKLASSDLDGAEHVVAALLEREQEMHEDLRHRVRRLRLQTVTDAVDRASVLRSRGNDAIKAGKYQAAVSAYDEAVSALAGFDSALAAAWPLVLCFSNRAQARLGLGMHNDALNDCACATLLLDRYDAQFIPEEVTALRSKLAVREKSAVDQAADVQKASEREAIEAALALQKAEQAAKKQQERLRQAEAKAERRREEQTKRDATTQRRVEAVSTREDAGARKAREAADRQQRIVEEAAERTRRALAEQQAQQDARERRKLVQEERRRRRQMHFEEKARQEAAAEATAQAESEANRTWVEHQLRETEERRARAALEAAEADDVAQATFLSRQTHAQERRRRRAEQHSAASPPAPAPATASSSASSNMADNLEPIEPGYECPICLDGEEAGPFYRFCGKHPLHLLCMEQWRKEKAEKGEELTCPMCRNPICM